MIFKTDQIMQEFVDAPVILQMVGEKFNELSLAFGKEAVCVRVSERIQGSSGVHEDDRGIDFRNEYNGVFLYTEEEEKAIVDFINAAFPRNDGRLTCISHGFKGGPKHFHLQIPFYTKTLRKKKTAKA